MMKAPWPLVVGRPRVRVSRNLEHHRNLICSVSHHQRLTYFADGHTGGSHHLAGGQNIDGDLLILRNRGGGTTNEFQ